MYIFAGLPGSGKSTLARALARDRGAALVRADTIEQALRDSGIDDIGPIGYRVGCDVASENLSLGRPVVADSVNPWRITREMWRDAARRVGKPFVDIEVVCSDVDEHRRRVDLRKADVLGLRLPTWSEVLARKIEPWDALRVVVDTAGRTVAESTRDLLDALDERFGDEGGKGI